jgi:3-hydroxyacyl-CoA dehydrogenase
MAVASYTYDALPADVRKELPDADRLTAALDWREEGDGSNTFGFRLALFGPFAIGDMAGLDVYASSFRTLEKAYGERFAAPEALVATVKDGNLGLKSSRGFLDIDPADQAASWPTGIMPTRAFRSSARNSVRHPVCNARRTENPVSV